MSLERQRKLMEVLIRRTDRGEIEWQEGFPDVFQVSFKDNSIQLSAHPSERQADDMVYTVSLLNSNGEIADRFTDEDLDRATSGMPGVHWYGRLTELHAMARRRARGGDKVLDAILKEVDDEIPSKEVDDDIPF